MHFHTKLDCWFSWYRKQWEIRRSEAICKEITAAYELLSNETRAIQYHLAKDEDNEELVR